MRRGEPGRQAAGERNLLRGGAGEERSGKQRGGGRAAAERRNRSGNPPQTPSVCLTKSVCEDQNHSELSELYGYSTSGFLLVPVVIPPPSSPWSPSNGNKLLLLPLPVSVKNVHRDDHIKKNLKT
ncbi:Hypothetical predicted protein [Xyrichtys novacula]|uniref:Uncharacterized protein n=1 Tax=Xyrichtys novacula TaxID=13765 RepID=A0AAV1EZM2_XYRNO|nr:Hypothetical predicted protein [Xyrichtys novacula]